MTNVSYEGELIYTSNAKVTIFQLCCENAQQLGNLIINFHRT